MHFPILPEPVEVGPPSQPLNFGVMPKKAAALPVVPSTPIVTNPLAAPAPETPASESKAPAADGEVKIDVPLPGTATADK